MFIRLAGDTTLAHLTEEEVYWVSSLSIAMLYLTTAMSWGTAIHWNKMLSIQKMCFCFIAPSVESTKYLKVWEVNTLLSSTEKLWAVAGPLFSHRVCVCATCTIHCWLYITWLWPRFYHDWYIQFLSRRWCSSVLYNNYSAQNLPAMCLLSTQATTLLEEENPVY